MTQVRHTHATGAIALALIGGLCTLGTSYYLGLLETVGYEEATLPGGTPGQWNATSSLGFSSMYLVEGQTAFVSYDAKVRSGGLRIRIRDRHRETVDQHTVHRSGNGELRFEVPASGVYRFDIDRELGVGSTDLDYTATWGARW
jgi:hypothetical protein